MDNSYIICEIIFIIEMITQFFLEYNPIDSEYMQPVRDIKKISIRYVKSKFVYDFIPLIPF